ALAHVGPKPLIRRPKKWSLTPARWHALAWAGAVLATRSSWCASRPAAAPASTGERPKRLIPRLIYRQPPVGRRSRLLGEYRRPLRAAAAGEMPYSSLPCTVFVGDPQHRFATDLLLDPLPQDRW